MCVADSFCRCFVEAMVGVHVVGGSGSLPDYFAVGALLVTRWRSMFRAVVARPLMM